MALVEITEAQSEILFAEQAQSWRGQSIGRDGVLPVTRTRKSPHGLSPNQPWWVHRSGDPQSFSGLLWVAPDMPVFDGHFPNNPILPGVLQIDWAITAAADAFEATPPTGFARMSQIKFLHPISPGNWLKLNLTREGTSVAFDYHLPEHVCTKGKLQYRG